MSPGQVKWPHLRKLSNRVTATVVERKIWNFQDLLYYQVPNICISRILFISVAQGQVNSVTSPL